MHFQDTYNDPRLSFFYSIRDFNYHKIILIRQQLNTTPTALIYKPSTLLHVQLVIIL